MKITIKIAIMMIIVEEEGPNLPKDLQEGVWIVPADPLKKEKDR